MCPNPAHPAFDPLGLQSLLLLEQDPIFLSLLLLPNCRASRDHELNNQPH